MLIYQYLKKLIGGMQHWCYTIICHYKDVLLRAYSYDSYRVHFLSELYHFRRITNMI